MAALFKLVKFNLVSRCIQAIRTNCPGMVWTVPGLEPRLGHVFRTEIAFEHICPGFLD